MSGSANVGPGGGRPHKWTPSSGGQSSHAALQGAQAGCRPEGLDMSRSFGVGAASDGLASLAEKEAAAQQERLQHKLNEAVKREVGTKSHQDGVGAVGHGALPS